jgi:hypothetical protein
MRGGLIEEKTGQHHDFEILTFVIFYNHSCPSVETIYANISADFGTNTSAESLGTVCLCGTELI